MSSGYRWPLLILVVAAMVFVAAGLRESAGTLIVDDFDHDGRKSRLGTEWLVLSDSVRGGASEARVTWVQPGADRSPGALQLGGSTLLRFSFPFGGAFVTLGRSRLDPRRGPIAPSQSALLPLEARVHSRDLRRFKGIEFFARGDGGTYTVELATAGIPSHDYHQFSFTTTGEWTRLRVPFAKLKQMGFGEQTPLNLRHSLAILFLHFQPLGATQARYQLQLDRVALY